MNVEVLVPNLPESVADATLVAWHKHPGDRIAKNEPLVDLETDKVVLEVPAPENGILSEIKRENGATVITGEILAIIDADADRVAQGLAAAEPDEPPFRAEPEQEPSASDEPHLSPAVRRLVKENELDPNAIKGSGKDGRLTKADVLEYLAQQQERTQSPVREAPVRQTQSVPQVDRLSFETRPEQRVPMTRLRARVAQRLLQAQQNAAMLTTFNEVSLHHVMALRQTYREAFEKQHGVKLGFMSFFVKATVEALKHYPVINASVDEEDIIYHGYYDIGIAVASDRGLVVPILRDADQLDFASIEKTIADFGRRARDGKLSYEDLSGGTFTITNGGVFGSMMSTPILNPPQSGILGMHAIKERPVVEKGEIVIRPMMYLALSYDHRIVDGREAVQFLVTIKNALEDPARLLLNV